MSLKGRLIHAWNAFSKNDRFEQYEYSYDIGPQISYSASRPLLHTYNDRSIVTSIITRMAVDVAAIDFVHADVDENKRYLGERDSGLNYCLTCEANIDQTARTFKQDIVYRMLSNGVVAVVPVDTDISPEVTGGYDIKTMRAGEVVAWYPKHVKVRLYNDNTGNKEDIILDKKHVAIIENPLYSIMNEPNSTLQRLMKKLNLLDAVDNELVNRKLNMIIKLPYVVKSEARRQQAEQRRKDIEFQLRESEYGIAYTDNTEEIVQLNRSLDNNLLETIDYMTKGLYGELGLTPEVLSGSANEQEMLNYYKRTIEPIAAAIAESLARSFLTKTARTQRQTVLYIRKPFDLVPMKDLAEIADKFTRNEILTSNEIRSITGFKPVADPKADMLRNSNMPTKDTEFQEGELEPIDEEESFDDEQVYG